MEYKLFTVVVCLHLRSFHCIEKVLGFLLIEGSLRKGFIGLAIFTIPQIDVSLSAILLD